MATAKAGEFKPTELQRKEATLHDGSVAFVRALRLTERLHIRRQVSKLDASTDEGALVLMIPRLLAVAVVDGDGNALLTAEEWDDYGAAHAGLVLDLFNTASELSGFSSEAAEKN
jgi:hypothetical protein